MVAGSNPARGAKVPQIFSKFLQRRPLVPAISGCPEMLPAGALSGRAAAKLGWIVVARDVVVPGRPSDFNHPTKILFKHDRSPSVASHTCVVSSCGRRGAMCARVSAGKKEARRATISRMTHAGPDQTHSIEFEAWPNRTWGEDSWQKSCQAWRVMKWSLCEDCGWVCEDHPGCRRACVAQQIAAPSSPGVVAENPARTSGLRSLG
jgi:hypothetical protein